MQGAAAEGDDHARKSRQRHCQLGRGAQSFTRFHNRTRLIHSYYYLATSVACFQICESGRDVAEFIGLVDDRCHLSISHEVTEDSQILFVQSGKKGHELLAHEPGPHISIELTKQTPGETVVPSCSSDPGHDADAIGFQNSPALEERMIPDKVIDQIVSLIGLGEIYFRV